MGSIDDNLDVGEAYFANLEEAKKDFTSKVGSFRFVRDLIDSNPQKYIAALKHNIDSPDPRFSMYHSEDSQDYLFEFVRDVLEVIDEEFSPHLGICFYKQGGVFETLEWGFVDTAGGGDPESGNLFLTEEGRRVLEDYRSAKNISLEECISIFGE